MPKDLPKLLTTLVPIDPRNAEQTEWLRVQRNRPELYKYFRQDKPITPEQQRDWWKMNARRVRCFLLEDQQGQRVGYVGFNPFNQYAQSAEFGLFILREFQGKGYGTNALLQLLRKGFTEHNLRNIYSDVLIYPDEPNRFEYYRRMGFAKHENQQRWYRKQGKTIPSTPFFMTKEMWETRHNAKHPGRLGYSATTPA